jgi:GNAT superfamily N-acetyltransferase
MHVERGDASRLEPLLVDVARLPLSLLYSVPSEPTREHFRALLSAALERPESARVVAVADAATREPAGALVIQKAEWESGIYSVTMARIPLVLIRGEGPAAYDASRALIAAARDVAREWHAQHLSALVPAAETRVAHAFERDGWRLVDSTLEFAWEAGKTRPSAANSRLTLRDARPSDRALRDLTKEVYMRSIRTRFLADPWLPAERTGELYARWFENAIDGTFADNVVIAELDGRPVGFNMIKIESDLSRVAGMGFAAHGIAAVDPITRGLGAQPAMLHYSTEWFGKEGGRFTRGRVLINNQPMQRACLKSGGFIAQAFHTFHAWLGDEPPPSVNESGASTASGARESR